VWRFGWELVYLEESGCGGTLHYYARETLNGCMIVLVVHPNIPLV
jgi:hypothetical protein